MLKISKNNILQDFLRTAQGNRGYGLQICNGRSPLQIYAAYSNDIAISEFKINQIDAGNETITSITLANDLIKYRNGQYLIDKTKLFEQTIPEGVYYYEFTNDKDVFYSEIFKIESINEPFLACSSLLASDQKRLSDSYEQ